MAMIEGGKAWPGGCGCTEVGNGWAINLVARVSARRPKRRVCCAPAQLSEQASEGSASETVYCWGSLLGKMPRATVSGRVWVCVRCWAVPTGAMPFFGEGFVVAPFTGM